MLLATDAVVLHAFDYMESSRIVRLATRDGGVMSALARGARRPKSRFGGSLDLYTGGVAQLAIRPTRDLQTLTGFDATRGRHRLAASLAHFTAAAALGELALRFVGDGPNAGAYDALVQALDTLAAASPADAPAVAVAGAWHLVAELGFAPSLESCALCHAPVPADEPATFGHGAGGVLCARCASRGAAGRPLPPRARQAVGRWLTGAASAVPPGTETAAHQRLLRLFVQAHLGDGRPLTAFDLWEQQRWGVG